MTLALLTLDFTDPEQRDCEWIDVTAGAHYRFLDRGTGTGFHMWTYDPTPHPEYGEPIGWGWHWHGVMVHGGPFVRVDPADELGEDADWDEGWL